MRNWSNVLSLILVLLLISGFPITGSSIEEDGPSIVSEKVIEIPTRWMDTTTNIILSPDDEGSMRITENISSENEIAFTFEKNSLRSFSSLPATFHTSQDIGNGNVIATSDLFTFVAHIIRGPNGAWFSFWLSRYDHGIDQWDQSIEVHNVSGIASAGCELEIVSGQLFYGFYLISSETSDSHLYVKHIDLDTWTGLIDTVPLKIDRQGKVIKGGKFLSVDNRLLVFWATSDDDCYMASYASFQWTEPARILGESSDIAPVIRETGSGPEVVLIFRKNLNEELYVISSNNFGLSWSSQMAMNISFLGEVIQMTTTSYKGIIHMMIVQRGSGIVRLYRSEDGKEFTFTGFNVDVGLNDQLDGRFQGHITADRSQVVLALENGDGEIEIYVSKDEGISYTPYGTIGANAWCPVLDNDKGFLSYYQDYELVIMEFTSSSSGYMRSLPIDPLGISSWEDFGFLVDGFGSGSSLSMRIIGNDGVEQLFPETGFIDVLSLGGGTIDGSFYTCYGRFTGDWRSKRTGLGGPIFLEIKADRAEEDQPAILEISINHTNSFPFDHEISSNLHILSIRNMTLRSSGIQIDDMEPEGSFIIGPIENEDEWCDLIDISFSSIGSSAKIKVGIRDSSMAKVATFSVKDSIEATDSSAPNHIRWERKYLKDLPNTIEKIYLEFVIQVDEPTTRTTVESFGFHYSEPPQFVDVKLERTSIFRGEGTELKVNVTDEEESERFLNLELLLKDPISGIWSDDLIEGQKWEVDRWSIPISTDIYSNIGVYEMKAFVTDSMGNRSELEDPPSIEIMNNRPIAPEFYILPDIPTTGDEVGIEIFREGRDLETIAENLTYNIRLYRDSALYLEVLNHTEMPFILDEGIIKEGEVWDFRISTWDGIMESDPSINTITVFNSKPFNIDHPNNITLDEDMTSEGYDYMSWFGDKDGEELMFDFSISQGLEVLISNGTLKLVPDENFNGEGLLTIKASDEEGSVRANIEVIVNPVNDPPVIGYLNDTQVEQGRWLEYFVSSNDPADMDPLEVVVDIIDVIPGVEIGVNYMELPNGTFHLHATNEMVGTHTITITASDGMSMVNRSFTIEVINVNDAPLKPIIEAQSGKWIFNENENVVLQPNADDPDIPWGDTLAYQWTSSISGDLGSTEILDMQLTPGTHMITLEVYDSELLTNTTSIMVEVSPLAPTLNNVMETFTLLLLIGIITFIIGLIIALILFLLTKKSRAKKEEEIKKKEEKESKEKGEEEEKKKEETEEGGETSEEKKEGEEREKYPDEGQNMTGEVEEGPVGEDTNTPEGGEKNE